MEHKRPVWTGNIRGFGFKHHVLDWVNLCGIMSRLKLPTNIWLEHQPDAGLESTLS